MYAPPPSLSQLTTTLIGNSSQAIPQIVQTAIFSKKNITKKYKQQNKIKKPKLPFINKKNISIKVKSSF